MSDPRPQQRFMVNGVSHWIGSRIGRQLGLDGLNVKTKKVLRGSRFGSAASRFTCRVLISSSQSVGEPCSV